MTDLPEMPERLDNDGGVKVSLAEGYIVISAACGGKEESILVSPYNAWRIFGLLSVLLGLPLSKAVSGRIRL